MFPSTSSRLGATAVARAAIAATLFVLAGCGTEKAAKGQTHAPLYSDAERREVVAYWNVPGRYVVEPSPEVKERINVTVAGSAWYRDYVAALAARPKDHPVTPALQAWFEARREADRARAGGLAAVKDPGPTPTALKAILGDPPPLYEKVQPKRYTITFAPEDAPAPFVYTDALPFGDRKAYYGYYRQANGVQKFGKNVKWYAGEDLKALNALFATIGKTDFERRVLQGVSALEGGFESVNTYDTGYVSIGLIQFIFAREGNGSLSAVLARMKADDPAAFQSDFRRFGIEVGPDTVVDVVDPATGQEKHGADAVQAVINDKRLTAVFERAGNRDPFRRAQVLVARARYWPGDDPVTVSRVTLYEQRGGQTAPTTLGVYFGAAETLPPVQSALAQAAEKQKTDPQYRVWTEAQPLTLTVSDLVKSEAGMATLMDRKVNRGNIRGIDAVAADIMRTHNLQKLEDVALYERELIDRMKYRAAFLEDPTLTQPPTPPQPPGVSTLAPGESPAPRK
jgi:hypothetical protein